MQRNNSFSMIISLIILCCGLTLAYFRHDAGANMQAVAIAIGTVITALLVTASIQIADQWDRAVILRLGTFSGLKGPGIFFIMPVTSTFGWTQALSRPWHLLPWFSSTKQACTRFGREDGCGQPRILATGWWPPASQTYRSQLFFPCAAGSCRHCRWFWRAVCWLAQSFSRLSWMW